ncbi:M24 family metallopeptidase [Falsiroseomonas oryzae]|uniref:M24 family metallopeptidase n=1 Tax=Falsiroseomonas oryzae TaxID=2766473 RepID=UPI0022EA84DA|nr:M24 family metallopeptidase [Roseomonas sp. MO-31]
MTPHPAARPALALGHPPLPPATFAARRAAALAHLRSHGIDALVVASHGLGLGADTTALGYARYLCDWDGGPTPSLLLAAPNAAPVLLVAYHTLMRKAQQMTDIADIRAVGPARYGALAAGWLAGRGAKRIGIVGRAEMPLGVWMPLAEGLPGAGWVDVEGLLDGFRVAKDAEQLAIHRAGAAICDAMFAELARHARAGVPMFVLKARMEQVAREAGCDFVNTWISGGRRADYCRYFAAECGHVPREGDQLLAGVAVTLHGHWAHAVRSGHLGEPPAAQRAFHDLAREIHAASLAALQPGCDLWEVHDAAVATLERAWPDWRARGMTFSRAGHGLGLSYYDPVATTAFPVSYTEQVPPPGARPRIEARPGMVLELHPIMFDPEFGGAALGDMVLVTETGTELLTHAPRELAIY